MQVSDIMTKEVVTVQKETPLKEAAGILAKLRIHGMPVTDDGNNIEGIVTESDFFMKDSSNIYLPTFFDFIREKHASASKKIDTEKIDKISKVEDIMTKECVTVNADTSVEQLVHLFQEKKFNSLPVVNDENALVGIVTIMDIIKLF